MRPSIERVVNEYARLRKEAFRLRRLVDEVPELRNEFRSYLDEEANPQRNCPAGYIKSDLVVATIMDEFSAENWSPEFCNIMLSFKNWEREIDHFEPDLLFVESAWKGNYSEWSFAFEAPRIHSNAREFDRLIASCRKRGIPTIFWNKEDPLHFDKFLDAAGLFDVVFTTDSEAVAKYKSALGHENVCVLSFAAQPFICNPVGKNIKRDARPFFAGSYYAEDHGSRVKQMHMLFDALLEQGGVIYDRNYHSNSPEVQMPSKYKPICEPPVPFDQIVEIYKRHSCAVNVNSVTESPTMMSRRVFEVLACATPVISTRSNALENTLGDVVEVVNTPEDVSRAFKNIADDKDAAARRGHLGYRKALRHHTYRHRLRDISRALDRFIPNAEFSSRVRPGHEDLRVSLVVISNDPALAARALKSIMKQTFTNFDLIFVAGPEFTPAHLREIEGLVAGVQSEILVEISELPQCIRKSHGQAVALLRDCDLYGPEFLYDFILPLSYTEAEIIVKPSHYKLSSNGKETVLTSPDSVHRYVETIEPGPALVMKRAYEFAFPTDNNRAFNERSLMAAFREGVRIYATDPYNVLAIGGDQTLSAEAVPRNCLDMVFI